MCVEISRALGIEENIIINKSHSNWNKEDVDEHNEVCEVCEIAGDLLCCETCTLVYHLSCLRPKITSVPKGRWSCVNCIIDVSQIRMSLYLLCDKTTRWKRY